VADERNLEALPENDEGGQDVEGHMETLPRADEGDDVEGRSGDTRARGRRRRGSMETLPRADG
jgi:hypothetical protein